MVGGALKFLLHQPLQRAGSAHFVGIVLSRCPNVIGTPLRLGGYQGLHRMSCHMLSLNILSVC